jgi:predicted nuclease with TOPRIM domain
MKETKMNNYWLERREQQQAELDKLILENADLKAQVERMEAEYNEKLEQAYEQLHNELMEAQRTTEQGYQEAYDIICDLRNQLEKATGVKITDADLINKCEKKDDLEARLYEEYEKKVKEMKEFIVDRVDAFLKMEEEERNNILAARLRKAYTPQQIVDAALES